MARPRELDNLANIGSLNEAERLPESIQRQQPHSTAMSNPRPQRGRRLGGE